MIRYLPVCLLLCWGNSFAQGYDTYLLSSFLTGGNHTKTPNEITLTRKLNEYYAFAINGDLPNGTRLLRRLSDNISIVYFDSEAAKKLLANRGSIIGTVNNRWKLAASLLAKWEKNRQVSSTQWLLTVKDIPSFLQQYETFKGIRIQQIYESTGSLLVNTPSHWLTQFILDDPNILFIAESRKPNTERELTGFDLSANKVNLAHRSWPEINGSGLTLSIKENRMDTADIDIRGRYLPNPKAPTSLQVHATNMATIATGAGNTYYTGKGVAWGANVSSSDFANLLPDDIQELQQLKVSVQNHSYGVGIENYYGADAAAYDAQLYDNPTLLHIFSSGNVGNQASGTGRYAGIAGYANLSGSFKMAKNILTVGATDSFARVAIPSSKGPAFDGRIKPELVALGEDGSSGSAAIVAGLATLVQDAWKQKTGSLPSSAVTASILLNSAEDTGPAGPDFTAGFGSANAWRALQTIKENRVIQGNLMQGQAVTHLITLPPSAVNLKITLRWIDPPGQPNTFKALVNDLDLVLENSTGTQQWLPWVLNSFPLADSLQQIAQRKRDSLNNTEQVTLNSTQPGTYKIMVKGYAVTGKPQDYAIAWQYDLLDQGIFTYPVKGDNLFPLQSHTLRWETQLSGTASLDYKINDGPWRTMADKVNLSQKWVQIQAPDTLGAVQFRLSNGVRQWVSDTVSLSPNLLVKTGLNCVDSFLIYWQRAGVAQYRVYRLGNRYLEPFGLVSDTLLIQSKQQNPYRFFTIAPVLPFQVEGNKSYAFDYTRQQVDCYLNGFIADPSGSQMARLSLQLGSLYRLSRIVFEKKMANGFDSIKGVNPVTSLQNTILVPAGKGLNTYRARIILQDGHEFLTQPEQVYQFGAQPFYVFPNPLLPGQPLQLLAEDIDDTVFLLYDANGREIFRYTVNGFLSTLRLPLLKSGLYFYTLMKSGVKTITHKLLIL